MSSIVLLNMSRDGYKSMLSVKIITSLKQFTVFCLLQAFIAGYNFHFIYRECSRAGYYFSLSLKDVYFCCLQKMCRAGRKWYSRYPISVEIVQKRIQFLLYAENVQSWMKIVCIFCRKYSELNTMSTVSSEF